MIIRFLLRRIEDETGISGVGDVAEGVILSSGKCVLAWTVKVNSVAIYESLSDLKAIHCHGGKTEVIPYDAGMIFGHRCDGCGLENWSLYDISGKPHLDCSSGGSWINL